MSNMGYCRFQNTSHDLLDCYENWSSADDSDSERTYREGLLALCIMIVEEHAHHRVLLTEDEYERLVE